MSLRPTLRTAVLTAVTAGAVLLPCAVAMADGTPTPVPAERPSTSTPAERPTPAPARPGHFSVKRVGEVGETVPAGRLPRGGVNAGERPAANGTDTTLYGSAAAAALLAGAGVIVVRRRSAAQHNG